MNYFSYRIPPDLRDNVVNALPHLLIDSPSVRRLPATTIMGEIGARQHPDMECSFRNTAGAVPYNPIVLYLVCCGRRPLLTPLPATPWVLRRAL